MRFQRYRIYKLLTLIRLRLARRPPRPISAAAIGFHRNLPWLTGLPHDAARGDHDPATVLALDRLDAAKTRLNHAVLDLDDAVAACDQRGAVIDPAQHEALDGRLLQVRGRRAEHHRGALRRDRAGDVRGGRL